MRQDDEGGGGAVEAGMLSELLRRFLTSGRVASKSRFIPEI